MIEKLLNWLFEKREIVNCDNDLYLNRWYVIRRESFGLFIHKFVRSDEDRALHDHPWDFIVIPIWRGYVEVHEAPEEKCQACFGVGQVMRPTGSGIQRPIMCPRCLGEVMDRKIVRTRVFPILSTRWRGSEYRHRVELLPCDFDGDINWESDCPKCRGLGDLPAWSIFIRFRKLREWGFWEDGKRFIQWNRWWREKGCGE